LHCTEAECKKALRARFAWEPKKHLCLKEFKGLKVLHLASLSLASHSANKQNAKSLKD